MAHSILVAMDDSEQSIRALEMALTVFDNPAITVLHVLDPTDLSRYSGLEGNVMTDFGEIQRRREQQAENLLENAEATAADHGMQLSTQVRTGDVVRTVVDYAAEQGMDHIVVGSHGRQGAARVMLGSVAETIARRSPVPVTVVR